MTLFQHSELRQVEVRPQEEGTGGGTGKVEQACDPALLGKAVEGTATPRLWLRPPPRSTLRNYLGIETRPSALPWQWPCAGTPQGGVNAEGSHCGSMQLAEKYQWKHPGLEEAGQTPRPENDTGVQEAPQEYKASAGTHRTWRRFSHIQSQRVLNINICQ